MLQTALMGHVAMNSRLITAVALCLVSVTASAQRLPDIEKGVRIRVTESPGQSLTGSFVAATRDSVTLITDGASFARSLPSTEVTKVEVSTGLHRGQGALIKGAIGLGIGVAAGALLGSTSTSDRSPGCFLACTRGQTAALGAFLGGGAGLLIGTIAGVATGNESWAAIQFRRARFRNDVQELPACHRGLALRST